MSSRFKSEKGFTLIETVIAVMIMVGALIVVGNSWSGNLMRIDKARINTNMANLLERKMTELELQYRGKPLTEIKEEDAGEFEGPLKSYKWEMRSKEFEMPDLSGVLSAKDKGADEISLLIARTVAEYVKTAVKEVTVTITYHSTRAKSKDVRQSATTYFMDYTKALSISGLAGGGAGGASGGGSSSPTGGTK